MAIVSAADYLARVKARKPRVFFRGEVVPDLTAHPITQTVVSATARIFELANEPAYADVMTALSSITGERISRSVHISHSTADLQMRAQMALLTSEMTGTCNYRCPGCDALHALAGTTLQMDRELGTQYHARFREFMRRVERDDLAVSGGLTDAKGDRSVPPAQQNDPDMYVRVVEKNADGIVVCGAKVHQSGAICADETVILPGQSLRHGDEAYAVAFAVPNGAPGITYVCQYTPYSAERMLAKSVYHLGNPVYGQRETSMVVFHKVFVPWERVFMCGEVQYARQMVSRFARMHRMNCGGACKVGYGNLMLGAARALAEMEGVVKAPHIVAKLAEMARIIATSHACAIAAAERGAEEPAGSGVFLPDSLFGNVAKLNSAEGFWELMKLAGDIAGGIAVTMPSFEDLASVEVGEYVRKYLKVAEGVPVERRMRMVKFIQNWTAGLHGVGTWHGAGSPQAQRMAIYAESDLEGKKRAAERLAGLD